MFKKAIEYYRDMLVLFIISLLSYAVTYSLNVFLARHLNAAVYGDFSVGLELMMFMAAFLLLGTNTSSKKFFQEYLNSSNPERLHAYLKWNFLFLKKSILISTTIMIVFSLAMAFLHITKIKMIGEHHLAIYFLWASPLMAICLFISSLYNSNNHFFLSSLFRNFLYYFIMLILFIGLVFLIDSKIKTIHILAIVFLSLLILFATQLFIMQKNSPFLFTTLRSALLFKPKDPDSTWRKTSLYLLTNTVIFQAVCTLDLLLVELMHKNPAAVGWYAAVLTITGVNWLIESAANNYLGPNISPSLKSGKKAELQNYLNHITYIKMALLLISSSLMIFYSKKILLHFGPDYIAAEAAFIISIVTSLISGLLSISSIVLAYSGYERKLTFFSLIEFFILLITGIIGVHFFGLKGVATASAIATLYKLISCSYYVHKKLGLKPW